MTFTVLSASDVPSRGTRTSKTTPLRNALAALQIGEAIEVSFDTHDPEAGYRATTISQVAGTMTSRSTDVKYSVRKKADGTGCYLIASAKPAPSETKRKSKAKSTTEPAAAESATAESATAEPAATEEG